MTRPLPAPAPGSPGRIALAWLLPAAAALLAAGSGLLWLAGGLAGVLAGGGWPATRLTLSLAVSAVRDGPARLWPATPPGLVWGLTAALALLLVTPTGLLTLRWAVTRPAGDDPRRSLARRRD